MIEVKLNKLSGHDKSAKVGKILVKENQDIKSGDVIFNAESSKGNFKVTSEYEGKVLKLLIKEGETVKLGDVIIHIDGNEAITTSQKKSSYSFGLSKPKKEDIICDIAIVGGGPGGYVAAIKAAQLGASVTLIEQDQLGGTCLNYGCIPTKSFVKSAHLFDEIKNAEEFGISVTGKSAHMDKIVHRKNEVVSSLVGGIHHLLETWNIKYISGEAQFSGDTITVNNKKVDAKINAKNIILAVGSSAIKLNIPGADLQNVLTNKEILQLKEIPETLTIIGGGVIGMEFAFIFNSLGSKVTVVEYLDSILFTLDDDIIEIIKSECDQRGIKIFTSAKATEIMESESGKLITAFEKDNKSQFTIGDYVLMSVGRRANLDTIDFASLNIELNEKKNGIKVNEKMQTSNEKFYAIGDVTNIIQLAHVASHQGIVAVENILGHSTQMNYNAIPSAVFTNPEIGSVGISEKEAIKKNIDYKVSKFPFIANGKALTQGTTEGFVKVIAHNASNKVIGATIIGPNATDMISNFTIIIENELSIEQLSHTVFAHPTTAEAVHEALLGIKDGALHFA